MVVVVVVGYCMVVFVVEFDEVYGVLVVFGLIE